MPVVIFTTLKDRILKGCKNNSKKKKQEGKLNYLHSKLEACGAFQQILQQLTCTDTTPWESETKWAGMLFTLFRDGQWTFCPILGCSGKNTEFEFCHDYLSFTTPIAQANFNLLWKFLKCASSVDNNDRWKLFYWIFFNHKFLKKKSKIIK